MPAPLAIEVSDLQKTFRVPTHRVDTLKERVVRPFAQSDVRELRAWEEDTAAPAYCAAEDFKGLLLSCRSACSRWPL